MEVHLVRMICHALITRCGMPAKDVGVIAPYRSQLKCLAHSLQSLPDVEVNTVDQYQGRDKECILFSMVRSNEKGQLGSLLKDWRRMNVAFTRAKSKLVVIGSLLTLKKSTEQHITTFVKCISERGWILKLPKNGHQMYSTL
jgi:DNA replication ATP-dependent helicase Dna2